MKILDILRHGRRRVLVEKDSRTNERESVQSLSINKSETPDGSNRPESDAVGNSEILCEVKAFRKEFADHDTYVKEKVAKELTVSQLIQALQNQMQVIPIGKSANLQEMRRVTENHRRILSILAGDSVEYYDYKQLAEMTRLSPDGVRGMISELSRMGYKFRKIKEGKKARIQLVQPIPIDSIDQSVQPSASSDSNQERQ